VSLSAISKMAMSDAQFEQLNAGTHPTVDHSFLTTTAAFDTCQVSTANVFRRVARLPNDQAWKLCSQSE